MSNFTSKIASHPESKAIIARILAGDQLKVIARDFGLSPPTLSKFRQKILRPAALATYPDTRSQVKRDALSAFRTVRDSVPALVAGVSTADLVAQKLGRYNRILEKAEKAGELGNWASIDRAETAALQLQAQLRGEVNQVHSQTTVQMLVYTPQVHDQVEDADQGLVLDAAPAAPACAVEEIVPPPPPPRPVKPPRPAKRPRPVSRLKRLQALGAKERQEAIRLIGMGLDPFADAPPTLPD